MNRNKVIIACIVMFIDQITKILIGINDVHYEVFDWLSINYYQNKGAAWSIFSGHTTFLILASLVSLLIIFNVSFSYKENRLTNTCFALLYGGVLGNLIDRVLYGYVRDFIDIWIFNYDFPVFNIADTAIVLGVILLIIATFIGGEVNETRKRKSRK